MKIAVIQFSPSGNTGKITSSLLQKLQSKGHQVQLHDITGNAAYFNCLDKQDFIRKSILPHDVLLIGGPVYAHHLQYHVLDLIQKLPKPDSNWGNIAIPYITYGGISSGVALKESSKALKSSGRVVPLAMKIATPHRMTRAFMPEEFNSNKLQGEQEAYINELVNRIGLLNLDGKIKNAGRALTYNGLKTSILAKLVFVEKTWHAKRYPKVVIDSNICNSCGKCVKVCPVAHLKKDGNTIAANPQSDCIHCLNCVTTCTKNAVSLWGDLEKGRAFMSKMILKKGNSEKPESAVYPILENKMLIGNSKVGNFVYRKMFESLDSKIRLKKYHPVKALKAANIENADKILEIGFGSGYYTIPAASMIKAEAHYHAIDIHPMAIEEMTKKLASTNINNIKLSQMNAMNTLMPDASFDLVLLFGVIPAPFLPLDQLLSEMWRILEPGGRMAVWTIAKKGLKPKVFEASRFRFIEEKDDVLIYEKVSNQ